MTKGLLKTPKYWLDLDACVLLFENFRQKLEFDEPIPSFGIRYSGKLEGILNSVKQTYRGKLLNKTVLDTVAAYFNQLVRGHAFRNGNKRMAVLFTHYFLLMHKVDFTLKAREIYNFAVVVAVASEEGIVAKKTKELCKKIIAKFSERAK